ncbi:MAG: coenzyme F430 synthase [Methanobrevibacter sp.]|nr:coenzyme F430 synthase [Methanobrevibacter sp.]
MNVFLVDLTHGGVKISSELAKSGTCENVFAYDLYNTLKREDEDLLITYDVNIIKDLDSFKNQLKLNSIKRIEEKREEENEEVEEKVEEKDLIINPIHSSLNVNELLIEIADLIDSDKDSILNQYEIINHHQATELVLSLWKEETINQDIKTIEITGVKGKTSVAFLLKEIFLENNKDTLLLSSLGAYLFRKNDGNEQKLILQKDISITPANIINAIQLAKKIANPKCSTFPICDKNLDLEERMEESDIQEEFNENPYADLNYEMAIFENSLGICGLADIGILTNLVENYSIAKGKSDARNAKRQVFKSPSVVIEYETLNEFYPNEKEEYKDKINSFSLNDTYANVYCESIEYDIDNTHTKVIYHDLKTIDGKLINGKLDINCFAPGSHHILNVLADTTTALALGIDGETIQNALSNFKGINGRTNVREIDAKNGLRIIEEINPGINTKAIESSINMIKDIDNYYIIIGGKYGVTCEEINEDKLSKFLHEYLINNPNANLILTDELGKSLKNKINALNDHKIKIKHIEDYHEAQNIAIENNKNILFIYRSNYSQVSKR